MADHIADALHQLRQEEQELTDRLQSVRSAIGALELLLPSPREPLLSTVIATVPNGSPRPRSVQHSGVSLASRVVALLEEGDRAWTAKEVVGEYARRGQPIHKPGTTDQTGPTRTALHNAAKKGTVIKLADGRYRSAKFRRLLDAADQNGATPALPANPLINEEQAAAYRPDVDRLNQLGTESTSTRN